MSIDKLKEKAIESQSIDTHFNPEEMYVKLSDAIEVIEVIEKDLMRAKGLSGSYKDGWIERGNQLEAKDIKINAISGISDAQALELKVKDKEIGELKELLRAVYSNEVTTEQITRIEDKLKTDE